MASMREIEEKAASVKTIGGEEMKYILTDNLRRMNAMEHIRDININKPIEVHIKPYKKNRSNAQNNTMWMWLTELADFIGDTPEDRHEEFKVQFLGIEEKEVLGEILRKPKSTADLEPHDFAKYLTKIEAVASILGVKLPMPDDYNFAMMRG